MKRTGVVLLVVSLLVVFSAGSYAADKKVAVRHGEMSSYGKGCDGDNSPMQMFGKLGLDDKQKEAVRGIHLKTKKEMIQKVADIKVAGIELQELLSKETVDMAAAEAAVKKIEGLRTEKKMMHIRAMEEIKSNLNADQKKKFIEMMRYSSMKRHGARRYGDEHHRMGPMKEKGGMQQGKR